MYNGCGPCSELVHVYVINIIVRYHGNHCLRITGNGILKV